MWNTSDRRARLPSDWHRLRLSILRRDNYRCRIGSTGCSGVATDVDHILRGDDHRPENLQAACSVCHRKKTVAEAVEARRNKKARIKRPTERHPGQR